MPTVERTLEVSPAPAVVLAYLRDFSHAETWDPGTQSCTQRGSGDVGVGTSWDNVSKFAGLTSKLVYTLEAESTDRLVFVGTSGSVTSTDSISVVPSGRGSRVTYQADLELKGLAKLGTPVVQLVFERVANATQRQLTDVLNALPD